MTRREDDIEAMARRDAQADETHAPGFPRLLTLDDAVEDLHAIARLPVYETQFPTLDEALGLGGLISGQVHILAGGAGAGKTSLLLNLANHHAHTHGPVLFATLEMRAGHCVARAAAPHLRVAANSLIRGEVHVVAELTGVSPHITFVERCSLEGLEMAVRHLRARHGRPPLVVIDYLQLLAAQVLAGMERPDARLATTATSATLRVLGRELDAPLLVASSAGRGSAAKLRGGGKGGPRRGHDPRDLPPGELIDVAKESGDIEFDAAAILALHVADENDCDGNQIGTLTVAKARFGRPCHIAMAFNGERAQWIDRGKVERRKPSDEVDASQLSAERAAALKALQGRIVTLLSVAPLSRDRLRKELKCRREDLVDASAGLLRSGQVREIGKGSATRLRLAEDLMTGADPDRTGDLHA